MRGRLVANMSQLEVPYAATLIAVYHDNETISRPVASLHTAKRMAELYVYYDQPITIDNEQVGRFR